MHTTTPSKITKHVQRLISKLAHGRQALYLPVAPEPGAEPRECFPNVQSKIARDGGQMLCGWQIWEWPNVLVEAEFHAVWLPPTGSMVDVTPKEHGEQSILFLPDERKSYSGVVVDNVRMPLRDDLLIEHFIRVSEQISAVMIRGDRAGQHGQISVPAGEIGPLLNAKSFVGASIEYGLRDHDPCLCGRGGKYKRCHGRQVEAILSEAA